MQTNRYGCVKILIVAGRLFVFAPFTLSHSLYFFVASREQLWRTSPPISTCSLAIVSYDGSKQRHISSCEAYGKFCSQHRSAIRESRANSEGHFIHSRSTCCINIKSCRKHENANIYFINTGHRSDFIVS